MATFLAGQGFGCMLTTASGQKAPEAVGVVQRLVKIMCSGRLVCGSFPSQVCGPIQGPGLHLSVPIYPPPPPPPTPRRQFSLLSVHLSSYSAERLERSKPAIDSISLSEENCLLSVIPCPNSIWLFQPGRFFLGPCSPKNWAREGRGSLKYSTYFHV